MLIEWSSIRMVTGGKRVVNPWRALLLVTLLWALGGCAGALEQFRAQLPQKAVTAEECPAADADPDGYLRAICLYLVAEGRDVSPARPNSYGIKEIVPHPDEGTIWVFLTCCYLGDVAILDAATGEVIEFHAGAK